MRVSQRLESATGRARRVRPARLIRQHGMTFELLEDRVAPVVGALQRAATVMLGATDPLAPFGSSSSGIAMIRTPTGDLGTGELLMTGRDLLTAAHVVTDTSGAVLTGNFTVTFEVPQAIMITVPSTAITVNPGWNGDATHGSDIAIISLPAPAPAGAARYPLYTDN